MIRSRSSTNPEFEAHTWKPNAEEWQWIRKHAMDHAATIKVMGFAEGTDGKPLSRGSMQLTISRDPVGAPIFYRDVPLMPSAGEKGIIQPLDPKAVPLIAWRMRNLAEPLSHVVMTDLHSCANCHSFSRDGKTLGLDMDGPRNDKGLYAVVPVSGKMTADERHDLVGVVQRRNQPATQDRLHVTGIARRQVRDDHHQATCRSAHFGAGTGDPGNAVCGIRRDGAV
jgi:hypothetical protein